jgi:nucleotide-binding universal stress UspA family protein
MAENSFGTMAPLPLPWSGHRHKGNEAMLPPNLILSPIDFSDSSHAALEVAADFAARFGAELLLVHVVPAIPDLPENVSMLKEGEYDRSLVDAAAKRLSDLATKLAHKNVKARTEVGTANDVGMELVRSAEHNHADMIIIATHGMTGWHKIAFGSVAEKVVKQASCPVLVLRANAEEDAEGENKAASSAAASD